MSEAAEPTAGRYRHYKGGLYTVEGVGRHSETEEELVIYRSADGRLWARPLSMWSESVERDGERVPRFARLETE